MSIKFGVVTDPQYCDVDDMRGREYRKTPAKLKEAVDCFNSLELDFVLQLGDLIDFHLESYDPVLSVLKQCRHKIYNVLGNHDFCVDGSHKQEVPELLSLGSPYYSFIRGDSRFIALNGNGLSFNAYEEGSEMYKKSVGSFEALEVESEWWNGAVDEVQLKWLRNQLQAAEDNQQKAIILCHYPLIEPKRYVLWNSSEVQGLIEQFDCVKMWMNGHYHPGGYQKVNGIHYLTFKGMVEHKVASYSIVEIKDDILKVEGYGPEESRLIEL